MGETTSTKSLERNPDLVVAGVYERQIGASLERVWENVYDWEHLPYLHSEAFTSIALMDSGDWGWRARVEMKGGAEAEIELIANRAAHHYVARTLEGGGAPSEIWTTLDPSAPDATGIHVEFCVQPMPEDALEKLGQGYVGLYTLLWSQDEDMMQTRTTALADRNLRQPPGKASPQETTQQTETITLGTVDELRARLPMHISMGGHSFRIVEFQGDFVAHSTECPHLLGPLGECETAGGRLVCPWHGYEFDLRSGKSADDRTYRLRPAPGIEIEPSKGLVVASLLSHGRSGDSGPGNRHGSP